MNDLDHDAFSFARSAVSHGRPLKTDLISKASRLPLSDEEHPFFTVEQEAHRALGMSGNAEFLVIERARLLDGQPSAIHRVFLDPARFPEDFLIRHNFETDSLIEIYGRYGHKLLSRDTVLTARGTNTYEINLLQKRYRSETRRIVLDAEQQLHAADSTTRKPFVLEYLKASYLDDWKYEIKNRPA
jgi:DNA-binding GntR family transcriptional regulator